MSMPTKEQYEDANSLADAIYEILQGPLKEAQQRLAVLRTQTLKSERTIANLHLFDDAVNLLFLLELADRGIDELLKSADALPYAGT